MYPCLSGDITPEVSDAPGASNKGDKTAVDICDLTASHSGTHMRTLTHTQRRAKERDRQIGVYSAHIQDYFYCML